MMPLVQGALYRMTSQRWKAAKAEALVKLWRTD
jgi:hypothetical protein